MSIRLAKSGFTIVELLIVIVVIGILAAIIVVAFNGIRTQAENASLQSEASQNGKKVLSYKTINGEVLPTSSEVAGLGVGSGRELYYRVTPDGKHFCLSVNITGSPERAYLFTSTDSTARKGTCKGYILVPGNTTFGTRDFWVMKYEAKNVNGNAISQAAGTPWVNISQANALSTSQTACDGCHLISEAEWMTIAANVLGVPSNWSGNAVGSGYIYSGHNDNSPSTSIAADDNDTNGYSGTGNSSGQTAQTNNVQGNSQRRTLALSNNEVIWDLAGNIWEWTSGTLTGGQPGFSGETSWTWREWNNGALMMNNFPSMSRPGAISSTVASYSSAQGIGQLYSNYGANGTSVFLRGGGLDNNILTGVLALFLNASSNFYVNSYIGFRVAR